jgi:hypothetical protein
MLTYSFTLSLFPSSLPCSPILPAVISHKHSYDLMGWYYCNKLIERKWMFHLGIAYNTWGLSTEWRNIRCSIQLLECLTQIF